MTSDDMQSLIDELPGDIAQGAADILTQQWEATAVLAEQRQDAIAQARAAEPLHAVDGLGYLDMSVDAQIYHWWNHKMPGCWRDRDFRAWFKRNFPSTVVHSGGTSKTMILMPGLGKNAA